MAPHGQHPLLVFLATSQCGRGSRQQVNWAIALLTEASIAGTALALFVFLTSRGHSRAESRVRGSGMVLWGGVEAGGLAGQGRPPPACRCGSSFAGFCAAAMRRLGQRASSLRCSPCCIACDVRVVKFRRSGDQNA